MKRLLVSLALALCASGAGAVTVQAGGSETVTLPLWNVLTMTGTGATCVSTRLSDTPGSGQSQGTTAVSGSSVVTVGPYSTSTRHSVACSVGSLEFSYAPAAFVVTGGIIASDIDASDVPADEECLTYEGTGPALEWQACGGAGLADGDYGDVTVGGTGTTMEIDADAVTESMLKATNAATDEYVLTYESTVGDFEWQAAATGTIGGTLAAEDNLVVRTDGTGGSTIQASALRLADTTGDLQWEGTTADAFEGNFTFADPTADWTTAWGATGSLTIPGQLLLPQGSCSAPNLSFSGNADTGWYNASDAFFGYCHEGALVGFIDNTKFSLFDANYQFAIGNSGAVGFARLGTNVARISNGSSGNGWLQQTPGRAALAADYTNATATMSNVSALGVTLLAGQKYTFRMALRFSDSTAADGAVFDFDGGTATAIDFGVNCQAWDTALLLSADSTALATDFSITTSTGASKIVCDGSFTVNAAGTFIPRAAQEAHSAGTLTVEIGSYLWVEDTPFI